jgi:hypothetical protein
MKRFFIILFLLPVNAFAQTSNSSKGFIKMTFIDRETKQPVPNVIDTLQIISNETGVNVNIGQKTISISNKKGICTFKNIPVHRCYNDMFSTFKKGYAHVKTQYFFSANDTISLNIEIEKSKYIDTTKGCFYGQVIDDVTHKPIESFPVHLSWYVNEVKQTMTAVTDAKGYYVFQNLEPVGISYNLEFNHKPYIELNIRGLDVLPNTIMFDLLSLPTYKQ